METDDPLHAVEPTTVTITVSLDDFPQVSQAWSFTVEIICQVLSLTIVEHEPDISYRIVNDGLVKSTELIITQSPLCEYEQIYTYTVKQDGITVESPSFLVGDLTGNTFSIQSTSWQDIGTYSLTMTVSLDDGTGEEISISAEIAIEILPCQVESFFIRQFPELYNYTIFEDPLELKMIYFSVFEIPSCLYHQTIETEVTKDDKVVEAPFLTQR